MAFRILVLGASYGPLLGANSAMAGDDVTPVRRAPSADLINRNGTDVCLELTGEQTPWALKSAKLAGSVGAAAPDQVAPRDHDLAGLAIYRAQAA
jgi:hypothetical protein